MASSLAVVMAWMVETANTSRREPPDLFVVGSTLARDNLTAAEGACDSWLALRGSCRGLRRERGVSKLNLACDLAFYHLEVYEEWHQQVLQGW